MNDSLTLNDIGEFKLLKEYIFPIIKDVSDDLIGDDCAFVNLNDKFNRLVITTDAGPKPLVMNLGYNSFFSWGWYTILVNVSDLASTGCVPLVISLSIDAPGDLKLSEIKEFYEGVSSACKHFEIKLSGGNIRAGKFFSAHGTATGLLDRSKTNISRKNCCTNDVLVSIGDNGEFISYYLKARELGFDCLSIYEKNKLIKPNSQLRAMQILNNNELISSASDNSDGILGSIINICERSNCGFKINFDEIIIPDYIKGISERLEINPWNLFLFWGDWQMIVTVRHEKLSFFRELSERSNIKYTILGEATSNYINIEGILNNKIVKVNAIRNDNFHKYSYSNTSSHIDYMLNTDLFN